MTKFVLRLRYVTIVDSINDWQCEDFVYFSSRCGRHLQFKFRNWMIHSSSLSPTTIKSFNHSDLKNKNKILKKRRKSSVEILRHSNSVATKNLVQFPISKLENKSFVCLCITECTLEGILSYSGHPDPSH